jgi:hypothetical protein
VAALSLRGADPEAVFLSRHGTRRLAGDADHPSPGSPQPQPPSQPLDRPPEGRRRGFLGAADFWGHNRNPSRIAFDQIRKIEDGERASLTILAKWLDGDGKPLLLDERVWTLTPRYDTVSGGFGEYTLDLRLTLTPVEPSITLGKTNFGLVSVRVAKMMGTLDGGGTVRNSEGQINEEQLMPHRRARWCDYSGRSAPSVWTGVTLMDHPSNPNHPTYFHVRGDGWMGSSFSFDGDVVVAKQKPLVLKYRFYVHEGMGYPRALNAEWEGWAKRD